MEFTAQQIAEMTNGTVEGDGEVKISTFAKIEEAGPGSITFLANPKYARFISTTGASAVLVSRDFVPEHPVSATLIRVDDPYATLAHLLETVSRRLNPRRSGVEHGASVAEGVVIADDVYIGAFAYISPGARIGRRVMIYPRVYIGDNVEIGDDTVIYPGVTIYNGCRVGARCIIHAGAVIGADGFGFAPVGDHYEKLPQIGNVEIADDVEIGANTTIDRATMGSTRIDRGVKLDNLIQVAHNCVVGENTVIASQTGVAGSTTIGRHCMVGGQVGFAGHIHVGDNVQIGAQSGIPNSVADGSRLMGYPAVDGRSFARQAAALKRLPAIIGRLEKLVADDGNAPEKNK